MNKKNSTEEKILDLLMDTTFGSKEKAKREKLGEFIKNDINTAYRELKKNDELSVEEIKLLKECYQILENDSVQSLATIVSILAVCISVLSMIVSLVGIVTGSFGELVNQQKLFGMFLIVIMFELLVSVLIIYFCNKIQATNKENTCLRNNIIASLILIHEEQENF